MPLCYCFTNRSRSALPEDFEKKLSAKVADVLSKPMERIAVIVNADARICKAGDSTEDSFIMMIHSIGVFDEIRNPDYFTQFFDFLTETLKMPAKRMTLEFVDIAAHNAQGGQ